MERKLIMDNDFYNSVNADVIKNKQIQKATGMSPAHERWRARNDKNYESPLLKPVIEDWKTGWRIILSNTFIEDNMGVELPLPRFYQLAHRDFNTDSYHYFPLGISQLVALGYWAWYHSYNFIKNLGSWETTERRHKREINQARIEGYKEGRDFEFRTMTEDYEARINLEVNRRLHANKQIKD